MTKPRKRRRRGGDPQDPDRQPANLDHRKGHRSHLRDGLPELQRGGRPGGYRSNDRGGRYRDR